MAMTVYEKIRYSKCRLLIRHKLFGILLVQFPLTESKQVPTMATDNQHIFYNPDFVETLTQNQTMTCVLHELEHILFKHFMRFKISETKNQEEHKLINYALDYAINSIIINELAPHDNLLQFPEGVLYDEKFKGMNAEKILAKLKEEKKNNPKQHQNRMGDSSGFGQWDDHLSSSQMTNDTMQNTQKATGKGRQDQMNDIDKKLFKAMASLDAKDRGDLPAEMQRLVDEYLEEMEGKIDWKRYIKKKIQEIGRGQYTTSRVNRAYLPFGFYLPGQTGSRAKVALALDTSGSISNDDIVEFLQELRYMLRSMPFLEVVIYGCDAAIHGKARIKGLKNFRNSINQVLTGGGGTSFLPVFKDLIKSKDKDIKCLFYFTDGYGDQEQIEKAMGGQIPWETYWVVQQENKEMSFPFGKKIIMWKDHNEEEK